MLGRISARVLLLGMNQSVNTPLLIYARKDCRSQALPRSKFGQNFQVPLGSSSSHTLSPSAGLSPTSQFLARWSGVARLQRRLPLCLSVWLRAVGIMSDSVRNGKYANAATANCGHQPVSYTINCTGAAFSLSTGTSVGHSLAPLPVDTAVSIQLTCVSSDGIWWADQTGKACQGYKPNLANYKPLPKLPRQDAELVSVGVL